LSMCRRAASRLQSVELSPSSAALTRAGCIPGCGRAVRAGQSVRVPGRFALVLQHAAAGAVDTGNGAHGLECQMLADEQVRPAPDGR
jgi:hypothetical protein